MFSAVVVKDNMTIHHITSFLVHTLHAQIEAEMALGAKKILWPDGITQDGSA